jgi:hypothetical protein
VLQLSDCHFCVQHISFGQKVVYFTGLHVAEKSGTLSCCVIFACVLLVTIGNLASNILHASRGTNTWLASGIGYGCHANDASSGTSGLAQIFLFSLSRLADSWIVS